MQEVTNVWSLFRYGLPDSFTQRFYDLAQHGYVFDIRGHDFLSHMGKVISRQEENAVRDVAAASNCMREIEALERLARGNDPNRSRRPDLIVSFGPASGSYFANARHLGKYRWRKLPVSLEEAIQDHLSEHKYGKIHDVAMNAVGGWVMQTNGGSSFQWGGQLPDDLDRALEYGKTRKATISVRNFKSKTRILEIKLIFIKRLFLNHQHPTEYVLLFSDGHTHVKLHSKFEKPLTVLLEEWATNNKVRNFRPIFRPSCSCTEEEQQHRNSMYYDARGLFHLSLGDPEQALAYLSEARMHAPRETMAEVRNHYDMAIYAVRLKKQDPILEDYLVRRVTREMGTDLGHQSERDRTFRIDYREWMVEFGGDIEALEKKVQELADLGRRWNIGVDGESDMREWSYSMAIGREPVTPIPKVTELSSSCQVSVITMELAGSPVEESMVSPVSVGNSIIL
jgi:hypothetical protein